MYIYTAHPLRILYTNLVQYPASLMKNNWNTVHSPQTLNQHRLGQVGASNASRYQCPTRHWSVSFHSLLSHRVCVYFSRHYDNVADALSYIDHTTSRTLRRWFFFLGYHLISKFFFKPDVLQTRFITDLKNEQTKTNHTGITQYHQYIY